MTKDEIIEYLYDNNVRADITIEQMADDLADRKTEPNCEECKYFNEQALTYMKQCKYYFMECRFEPKDEPQTEAERLDEAWEMFKADKDEPQAERSE